MHLSYRWQATLVSALGLLMAILDTTIVSVVLPQIATAFHTDFQTITWVGTGYFLANATVIPIVSYLSDRIGSRTLFLIRAGRLCHLCGAGPLPGSRSCYRSGQGSQRVRRDG